MTELALHILDIVQNSISAKASVIHISVYESKIEDSCRIEITDNGTGMDEKSITQVTDPFYTSRTTRKVGLGLPLFKQAAEICGGSFKIDSKIGIGTTVIANMPLGHIDRQPLGDIAGVMAQLSSSYPDIDFVYCHKTDLGVYKFDTKEVKETLDGVPINNVNVIHFIRELIRENLNEIEETN